MKLTHTIEGEGSDVLLLHGFPSNIYFWDDIKKALINGLTTTGCNVEDIGLSLSPTVYFAQFQITVEPSKGRPDSTV